MPHDEPNYYAEPEDQPQEPEYRRMHAPPASGVSIASLVCGICFCIPMITSLLAVIFGFIGIRKTRDPYVGGRGLSIAGLVLGVIGIAFWLIAGALLYILIQFAFAQMAEVRTVSHQFVQDLSEGKLDAASALTVRDFDRKELVKASAEMKPLGPFNEIVADPVLIQNKNTYDWEINGRAIFNRAEKTVRIRMVMDGTTFRVERFEMK